jgi:thiol:disulfide interchange protein DsbC
MPIEANVGPFGQERNSNMRKHFAGLAAVIAILFLFVSDILARTPEESLKKDFPQVAVDSVTPSNIPGLYEVVAGQQIFYYAPEAACIVGGPIIMKGGRNLTEEKARALEEDRLSVMARKLSDMPLDKALKIGGGKNVVIEITNPDCSYCRRTAQFFAGRTDVTKYVFFHPLPMYKNAESKIRYIFCAKDKSQAYSEAMAGKLDAMKFEVCRDGAVDALVKIHSEATTKLGVTGTPLFFINGRPVMGANIPLIEKLLSGDNK